QDWGAIEEIVMSYRQAQASPLMIRAIAIYCLSMIDDANTNNGAATAEQITLATNTLQLVKNEHPERYQQAERFFQIEKRRNAAKATKLSE
ncbi:MAG TPA: hypothetical protein VLA12_17800, partial [Planctomycetaceae bacterium]|nr:hypothetical protein [Planctomycetaceae bacterium]